MKGDKLSSESTSTHQCFESLEHQSKHTQRASLSGKHPPHDLPLCQYLGTLPAQLVSPAGFEEDISTFLGFARCRARRRQTEAVVSPSSTAALSHVCPARRHLAPPQRLEGSGYERLALINDMHGKGMDLFFGPLIVRRCVCTRSIISQVRARFSGKGTLWKWICRSTPGY